MKSQYSLFDILIIIGIIQGVVNALLLLNSKKNKSSNKFLALALLSFCLLCTKTLLHTLSLWDLPYLRYFPNGIELALPPLVYFYVKSLLTPGFHFKAKEWLHFIPFALSQTYSFIVYFSLLGTNSLAQKDIIAQALAFDEVKQLDEYLLLISIVAYLILGYKTLKDYKSWLDNTISDSSFPDFSWLKRIFNISIVLGIFILFNHLLDIFLFPKTGANWHWHLLILFIAGLIYYLGLKGYLQPHYEFEKQAITIPSASVTPAITIDKATVSKLEKVMEEDQVFLNPKLSIEMLASIIGVPQRELSNTINQYFKLSFRDFINAYRVEEVKSKLTDSNLSKMSILGIANECGFNSEASFYRIFKKTTGKSPKEYLQSK